MQTTLETTATGDRLHAIVTGKWTTGAYESLIPLVNLQIEQHGKVRILFEMHNFQGWTAGALWEDIEFDYQHWRNVERLAIVGESQWEQGMSVFCTPFTAATIKYFDLAELADAKRWLDDDG